MPLRFKKLIENESMALTEAEKALYDEFLTGANPFGVPSMPRPSRGEPIFDYIQPLPLRGDGETRNDVLPIEGFRWQAPPQAAHRIFLSSGTTSGERSKAPFSASGLRLYKMNALYTFDWLMRELMGESWSQERGFSLIPSPTEWPDSSLAQMIGWISDVATVSYTQSLEGVLSKLPCDRPIWIFGTGYHFITLMQHSSKRQLHPGSVLLETGGTKGLVTEMPRDEYLWRLAAHFGVSSHRIVSEYGMCELASQAYDWCDADTQTKDRTFRFPRWVKPSVETSSTNALRSGQGCLVVDDPFRRDINKGIRTQDFVDLSADGRFKFCGRLVGAPLKGCSLRAHDLLTANANPTLRVPPRPKQTQRLTQPNRNTPKLEPFITQLNAFLESADAIASLGLETGSMQDARWVLTQTKDSLPRSQEAWTRALNHASGESNPMSTDWLFIAPHTHSLAMLYPLSFAYLLGYRVHLRLPAARDERPFLYAIMEFFRGLSFEELYPLPPSFRLGVDEVPSSCGAVLCYANDETIVRLHELTHVPIKYFGSNIAAAVIDYTQHENNCDALVRDAFSLGQQGCVNARFAILMDANRPTREAFDVFATHVQDAFARYWGQPLTERQSLALCHERLRYERERGAYAHSGFKAGGPLLVYFDDNTWTAEESLSPVPFTLPCYAIPKATNGSLLWQKLKEDLPALQRIYADKTYTDTLPNIAHGALGHAQQLLWNGTHDGKTLFGIY